MAQLVTRLTRSAAVGPALAMVLVAIFVGLTTDRFFQTQNLMNLSLQVSIVALMAIGSTLVILSGGIDLSPGSTVALLTMVLATLVKVQGIPLPIGILITLAAGAILGLVNGLFATYGRIPSFIVTVATMSAYRGIAFLFNNGSPIFSVSPLLEPLFYGRFLGVPLPFYYVLGCYLAAAWFLTYTRTGRAIYAVGGNAVAAHLSGIHVQRVQLITFVVAGLMSGTSAVLMTARLNSGSPNYGVGMELQAIAAAVIGGTTLAGGHGNIFGTLFGAMTIIIVQNGLNLHGVTTALQNVTIGAIILLAVGIDVWKTQAMHTFQQLMRRRAGRETGLEDGGAAQPHSPKAH